MRRSEWQSVVGPELTAALDERKFETLTDVQRAVLDPDLMDRDLRVSSQTGSGKTVAIGFALRREVEDVEAKRGIADKNATEPGRASRARVPARPRALVIVPTRELATQVKDELAWLYARTRARVAAVLGGSAYREELRALARMPAVVVGTPGRMRDHLERGAIDASGVRAVVLDEADRMLDMGFREELEAILAAVPAERRTHLVSATFPPDVRALADRIQRDPARVEGTPHGEANVDIEHLVHLVREEDRVSAIVNLVLATPEAPTLVFVRRRADVASLAEALGGAGFRVGTLSGEMDQSARERTLAAFKRGTLHVLVATDVAARGLDVQGVGRVIHAEPPESPNAYTHRSGRTGRAGQKGTSSILVGPRAFARTAELLRRARVAHRFAPVPTSDEIRAEQSARLFAALTEDRDEEVLDRSDETLAVRLEKSGQVTRALVRLLGIGRRTFAAAQPREVERLAPPPVRSAGGGSGAARARTPRLEGHERPVRGREQAGFTATAEGARRRRDVHEPAAWRQFRVSWGQAHGADTRRLLAMLCRRGGVKSKDIGTLRVLRTHSLADVAADVADDFLARAEVPDPRDPRVKIRLVEPRD